MGSVGMSMACSSASNSSRSAAVTGVWCAASDAAFDEPPAGQRSGQEERTPMAGDGQHQDEPAGPQPSRRDKRLYFTLMGICIGLFILSWAVLDRYSTIAAVIVSAVALVIPPFAVIIADAASAPERRRP